MKYPFKDFIFIYITISLLVGVFIFTSSVSADTTIPRIEPYVNDFAGLLTPQEELQLNQLADHIEANTTFEIAIVTVQSTGGQDRLQYANMIGDQNGVGKKDSDNGIVVLWSVSDEEGGAIATGRGGEAFITDSTTGTIGRAARSQYFDKEDHAGGFNYILNELNKVIVKHQIEPIITNPITESEDPSNWFGLLILFPILFMFIKALSKVFYSGDETLDYVSKELEEGDPGYYRKQVYKRHGNWYNSEADRSYLTAAAAAAALATMNTDDDSDSDSDDDSSSSSRSSSGGGFGGFGGGGFGGGGGKF